MSNARKLSAVVCLLVLAQLAGGQSSSTKRGAPPRDVVFSAETNLVVLHTTVLDKSQHFVTDLPQSSFKVYEDDVLQTLKIFKREDVPVSLGILVDNSGSMRDKRRQVEVAALEFVKSSNPNDEVFIVNFNDEAFLDSDFTSNIDRLEDALLRIDSRGGTALYDAIGMSLDHLEEKAKWDKRVLLVITDGEDNASRTNLEQLVRRLEESETVIYAVGLLSEEDPRSAKRAGRAVKNITRSTGGAVFFPKSAEEVHALTQQIAADIRNQYILGYNPDDAKGPGFRRVKVVLSGKARRLQVRHRPGYYAQ